MAAQRDAKQAIEAVALYCLCLRTFRALLPYS